MPRRLSLSESGLYQNCIHMFVSASEKWISTLLDWQATERQTVPFLAWSPAHRHSPASLSALFSQSYSFFIEVEAVKWGKESGCLLGGDNFYLDFSPSLCTQFKMTKQEESLISVVIVVVVVLSKGKTLDYLSVSLVHVAMVTPIPQYPVTKWLCSLSPPWRFPTQIYFCAYSSQTPSPCTHPLLQFAPIISRIDSASHEVLWL